MALAIAVIHQAQKDILRGNLESRAWLSTTGIQWAIYLTRNGDTIIRHWLQAHPIDDI